MRHLCVLFLLLALLGCKHRGESRGDHSSEKGRSLLVGIDPTTPPFESLDPKTNQPVGFDVDVMDQIGRIIGARIEYRLADFKTIFDGLNTGQFDAVISAVTITDDRKKVVSFSDPYVNIAQVVVTRRDSSRVKDVQDLRRNDAIVGVQTGTTGEHLLLTDALVQDKDLRRYDNVSLALADLKSGSIDAVVDDQPILLNFLSTPEFRGQLIVIGPLSRTESYGIVTKNGDAALLQQINAAIKLLRGNGELDRLEIAYHLR